MPDFETSAQFETNAQFGAYGEILDEKPDANIRNRPEMQERRLLAV